MQVAPAVASDAPLVLPASLGEPVSWLRRALGCSGCGLFGLLASGCVSTGKLRLCGWLLAGCLLVCWPVTGCCWWLLASLHRLLIGGRVHAVRVDVQRFTRGELGAC